MPTNPGIDLPTASALHRLRVFVEDAERRVFDSSEPGRQLALIALDGAVEYGLWLTATTINTAVSDRTNFHQLIERVSERFVALEVEWEMTGRSGIEQLHRARNQAQHAAVVPDHAQLSLWADAVRAFVNSLARSGFDIELDEIVLAAAVRDEELRQRLERAERAVEEDAEMAFSQAWIAFEMARERWRQQQHASSGSTRPLFRIQYRGVGHDVDERVDEFEDLFLAWPFATDLGEYVSLRASRTEQERGWKPEEGDARRAISFAVAWITRWETFERGYPSERFARYWEGVRPPVTGDGSGPELLKAEALLITRSSGRSAYFVRAELANLPERGRGDWGQDFQQAWVDAAIEVGAELPPQAVRLNVSGVLSVELEPDADAGETLAVLRRSIELVDERYHRRRAEAAEQERRAEKLERRMSEVLDVGSDDLIDEVAVSRTVEPDGVHYRATISVQTEVPAVDLPLVADLFRDQGQELAAVGLRDESLEIDLTDLSDEGWGRLAAASATVREELSRRRAARAEEREQFQDFARHIAEAEP